MRHPNHPHCKWGTGKCLPWHGLLLGPCAARSLWCPGDSPGWLYRPRYKLTPKVKQPGRVYGNINGEISTAVGRAPAPPQTEPCWRGWQSQPQAQPPDVSGRTGRARGSSRAPGSVPAAALTPAALEAGGTRLAPQGGLEQGSGAVPWTSASRGTKPSLAHPSPAVSSQPGPTTPGRCRWGRAVLAAGLTLPGSCALSRAAGEKPRAQQRRAAGTAVTQPGDNKGDLSRRGETRSCLGTKG